MNVIMTKLSQYELLSRVFNECTFNEILDFGLENRYIGSESIINAASIYSDPNKEYSDDELREIVREADLYLLLDVIDEKYTVRDIIDGLDKDDVLDCYDADDLIDHCEYELKDKYNEEREKGYNDGYDDGFDEGLNCIANGTNILKDGIATEKWCYLCDALDVSYYDNKGLYDKLNTLIKELNKSIYKNKKDNKWSNITLE